MPSIKSKAHFIEVFRSLFTEGDECDLKLTDPSNPLESGNRYYRKTKRQAAFDDQSAFRWRKRHGYRPAVLMYSLKPAPFCIFDEVDAPLDDANIDKFNNIIRTIQQRLTVCDRNAQQGTMTTTDVIYGITMVEKGVSRVVPVDLREFG